MDRQKLELGGPSALRQSVRDFLIAVKEWWFAWHWLILLISISTSLILGFVGFRIRASLVGETLSVADAVYLTLQLISLESGSIITPVPWQLQISRFLTPAIAAYAAVAALALLFRDRLDLFRLRFWQNHVVICGSRRRGLLLARAFKEQKYRVLIIDRDPPEGRVQYCRNLGVAVLIGDPRSRVSLSRARAFRAKYLIAVSDDAVNAEIALRVRQMMARRKKGTLTCFVDIANLELCRLLREEELATPIIEGFRLEFVNLFEMGARTLLEEFRPFQSWLSDKSTSPHMVVVGVGRFGRSLILNASREWERIRQDKNSQLRVSVIDRNANARLQLLLLNNPQLDVICDFCIHEMDTESPDFQRAGFLFAAEGECDISFVYVCLDDDTASLHAALALHRHLKERHHRIPVVLRMTEGEGLATMVPDGEISGGYEDIYAFRLLDRACRPEVFCMGINETIAHAIHSDYVEDEMEKGRTVADNPSMAPWEDLSEDDRENFRHHAEHLAKRFEVFRYRIVRLTDWDAEKYVFPPAEVEEMARMEHERWATQKRKAGFKHAPGPKTDKTHPGLVPWEELDEPKREKCREMVRDAPKFLAKAGFQVARIKHAGGTG